ncbi:MAG: hypothetical protein OEM97_09625 [Acidimicrobiia bacterium]|nr:hypothetical protein [Acidimicrobiia bacterium]
MSGLPHDRHARGRSEIRILLAIVVLGVAACGSDGADGPLVSTLPAVGTVPPATTIPIATATTMAPTTATVPATAAPPTPVEFRVESHGAASVGPLAGSGGMLGSGCTPGTDRLPDGIWFGWVVGTSASQLSFDLACLEPGPPPLATNLNTKLRDLPIGNDATVQMPDGSAAALDAWTPGVDAVWLYVNEGIATEVAYPLMEIMFAAGSDWNAADVAMPVTGGCCATMYQGPASPADPWPASGMPSDGVYAIEVTADVAVGDVVMTIRRFVRCEARREVCFDDFLEGDIGIDRNEAIVRRVPLSEDLTVRIRGIEPTPDAGPAGTTGIEGSGLALAALMDEMQAAYATWVTPRLEAGIDPGEIYNDLIERGSADPDFPYGASDGYGADSGPLAYRGPHGIQLVAHLGPELAITSWTTQLEVKNGLPILYLWAGQIAG